MRKALIDPLRNTVHVAEGFCQVTGVTDLENLCDLVESTIIKPAMVLQDDASAKRYYFRAITWQTTLLIETILLNDIAEASSCVINPSNELMQEIIRRSYLVFESN